MGLFTPTPQEEQPRLLAAHMPSGPAWQNKTNSSSIMGRLVKALSLSMYRLEQFIERFNREMDINKTEDFLTEWETSVGIPDPCFGVLSTTEDRRNAIIAKLARFNVQTAADFEALALFFGFTLRVEAGYDHYTDPAFTWTSEKEARYTMIVYHGPLSISTFTYTFPITFEEDPLKVVKCLFARQKPANVQIIYELDGTLPAIP